MRGKGRRNILIRVCEVGKGKESLKKEGLAVNDRESERDCDADRAWEEMKA